MKKCFHLTAAIIVFSLLLSSCASPDENKPLSLRQIEKKLEKQVGFDVEYCPDDKLGSKYYHFSHTGGEYCVNRNTGEIIFYEKPYNYERENPEELLNAKGAEQAARELLEDYCPGFFEYNYSLETIPLNEKAYNFVFRQLSDKGRRTGNMLAIDIVRDGTVTRISVQCPEDPETVDAYYSISQDEALDIAYEGAKENVTYISPYDVKAEIYFDDRESHDINEYITSKKGVQCWIIRVREIMTNIPKDTTGHLPIICFYAIVDANTGEVIGLDGDAELRLEESN